jgi:hypothetical protein
MLIKILLLAVLFLVGVGGVIWWMAEPPDRGMMDE